MKNRRGGKDESLSRVELAESTFIRIRMLQRGWDSRMLALRCGLAWSSIRHELALNFPNPRTRLICEDAFGEPVFSTLREWKRRKAMTALIGFDPYLATRTMVQTWASGQGIPFSNRGRIFKKAELIDIIARQRLQPSPVSQKQPVSN